MANAADIAKAFISGQGNVVLSDSGSVEQVDPSSMVDSMDDTEISISSSKESNLDDLMGDNETEQEIAQEKVKSVGDREKISVTDEKGKRQIEVDFSNREQIKKFAQMAHGARKWQAERDAERQKATELQGKLSEIQGTWDHLEKTFQAEGIEGIVDLLQGKKGAYKEFLGREVEKSNFLAKASPEEVQAFQEREQADRTARELERIRRENEKFREEMTRKGEEAELNELKSQINPVFNKYRFAEKLGDAEGEQLFDEMLWSHGLKKLDTLADKGIDLTPEVIDREFRQVSMALRKRINSQVEKKTGEVIERKKSNATESVQAQVKSGYSRDGGLAKEARDLIESRNLTGLLSGWKKYSSLFNK
jgi:hypothetical protein